MARRAVQGYSEKSFLENTRFMGMLATNDPLQEGYFKHLVNFNISDTGQSVRPRKGFLTTSPILSDDSIVSFSDQSVLFKVHSLQKHIAYDFKANKAYSLSISADNVTEELLVNVTDDTILVDYANVVDYLLENVESVKDYYTYAITAGMETVDAARGYIEDMFTESVTLIPATEVNYVADINGVKKNLIKVVVHSTDSVIPIPEQTLLIAFYYRKNAVTSVTPNLTANTLMFEVLDMNQHPTYLAYERNIASKLSIIPDPLQTVYTTANRPDGNVSSLGMIYVSDAAGENFYNEFVPRTPLLFRPHFVLDPAELHLNDVTAEWAYRIDITSLADNLPICKGNWFRYNGKSTIPTRLMPRPIGYNSTNVDLEERHYEGTHYVITCVPQNFLKGADYNGVYGSVPAWTTLEDAQAETMYDAWVAHLTGVVTGAITDKKSLLKALEAMEDIPSSNYPLFQVLDTRENKSNYEWSLTFSQSKDSIITNEDRNKTNYDAHFITLAELREDIENGAFDSYDFTWRLLPYMRHITYTNTPYDEQSGWYFYDSTGVGSVTPTNDLTHFVTYDHYNNIVDKDDFAFDDAGDWTIGFTSEIFTDLSIADFASQEFLKNGAVITFYMRPYIPTELTDHTVEELRLLKTTWTTGAEYDTARPIQYGKDALEITTITKYQEDDPENIQDSENVIIFDGLYTVTWFNNIVYISEPGEHYYYKEANKFEYGEVVIKVLEFKNILLVFTSQHLYAIYRDSEDKTTTDSEGAQTIVTTEFWATQKVLYNIRTSEKYKDVIQVFNEFILYYSEDGQLFLIKPNTMIDSETRFSLKYFNQSVNDVLLNYADYINERLTHYNIDHSVDKDDVQIKALLSVNFIKIFYYVPGYITYILIFDVINNRFFVYDTIVFTDISSLQFNDSGEVYVTQKENKKYLTFPYKVPNEMDSNVDMTILNNFEKIAISPLLDTGNMSNNNHLHKRFDKLHTVFKNLSASNLLYNVETELDDLISHPFYDTQLEVHEIGGTSYYVTVPKTNHNDLIDLIGANQVSEAASSAFKYMIENEIYTEDSILLNFAEFTSSKLLTHKASIRGKGKVLRLKMQFISKGDFKIQSFGVVYKERRI